MGINDQSDDIRGGMGLEGLAELAKFVRAGGTLITEGSTASLMVDYGSGQRPVCASIPADLAARGTILRGIITDHKSPLVYGFEGKDLPVYFNQDPVLALSQGGGALALRRGQRRCHVWARHHAQRHARSHFALSTATMLRRSNSANGRPMTDHASVAGLKALPAEDVRPRVVMQFPG